MEQNIKIRKITAFAFLIAFSIQTFVPGFVFALTSGPSTPEMKGFQPAGVSDMVDLFTGDLSYNIPLLDVGGYPVNIAYNSGSHPDDEASWVGFGWNLNPGAINRQMRGIPDDFDGDQITQIDNKKPNKTFSLSVNITKRRKSTRRGRAVKAKLTLSYNNYNGYTSNLGVPLYSFISTKEMAATNTQNLDNKTKQINAFGSFGLNSSSSGGVSPYGSFEVNFKTKSEMDTKLNNEIAANKGKYDEAKTKEEKSKILDDNGDKQDIIESIRKQSNFAASIDFGRFQPPQMMDLKMENTEIGGSIALGLKIFKRTFALRGEGSYLNQTLAEKVKNMPAYGFHNSVNSLGAETSIMDYNMEKDAPYSKELPNLGVPVFTNDLYSVSSNAGSMQFRSYLRGSGIFHKQKVTEGKFDALDLNNIGIELGVGNLIQIGVPLQLNYSNNTSGKWEDRNQLKSAGDFKETEATNLANRAFYFKQVGEPTGMDRSNGTGENYFSRLGGENPLAIKLSKGVGSWAFGYSQAESKLRTKRGLPSIDAGNDLSLAKLNAPKANHSISYLTAREAVNFALEQTINNYTPISNKVQIVNYLNTPTKEARVTNERKPHHISQFTVTQDNGQRMVYGLPVYNITQQEVSFSIDKQQAYTDGLTTPNFAFYNGSDNSTNNNKGRDRHYHKYITPAYTTGHLLTAILSPDYVDVTGDGVTDDDLGTAVKFNYSKTAANYVWRTPQISISGRTTGIANYSEGLKSDVQDDKANYSWGQKEIWNLHSLESKTMVAIFYTSNRNDGLGASGENGGINGAVRLKKLDKIELYSKSELNANPTNPTPIKTVYFTYDNTYSSLMTGLPNTDGNKGKLCLKSIHFTYGNNTKGIYHKYEFSYKKPSGSYSSCNTYAPNQSDRWGVYKDKSKNPGNLSNFEYNYATQNKQDADEYVSFWQLNKIEIPSGAIINIDYESDEYAFVQDRRATQMVKVIGIGEQGKSSDFNKSNELFVALPGRISDKQDFINKYLNDVKCIAYRSLVDIYNDGKWEYVAGFAEIDYAILNNASYNCFINDKTAKIPLKLLNGYNPISKAAWQKLKLEQPKLAYAELGEPTDDPNFEEALKAMVSSFVGLITNLTSSFDGKCESKGWGNNVQLDKTFIRLATPVGAEDVSQTGRTITGKLGGGLRVKKITITDQWKEMNNTSGVANDFESGTYGQEYDYTTQYTDIDGKINTMSSGVATYEPSAGGDENPLKEPINYTSKTFFAAPKYFQIEKPMGESYFPGASVGYSKVTVKNIGADGSVGLNGSNVNEFYTAKDFPVIVKSLPMEKREPNLKIKIKLWGATMPKSVAVSQGYSVENNNMHGKPKADAAYGKNGEMISSTKYNYKVDDPKANKLHLNNYVPTVDAAQQINPERTLPQDVKYNSMIGTEIDMFSEMNQAKTENIGVSVDPNFGVWLKPKIPFFGLNFGGIIPKPSWEKRLYRSASTIKLINRFGILESVEKIVNGSKSITTNMLWDEETGEVLLTKTNNEFNDDVYTFSQPAHWIYDGMGTAFKNEGIYFGTDFTTDNNGLILPAFAKYLAAGDEIIPTRTKYKNNKYWVIEPNTKGSFYLIDKDGKLVKNLNPTTFPFFLWNTPLKLMRSGRRNLAQASVGSIITMVNPMQGNSLVFNNSSKVLQAKAVEYSNDWHVPVADTLINKVSVITETLSAKISDNSSYLVSKYILASSPYPPYDCEFDCATSVFEAGKGLQGHVGLDKLKRSYLSFGNLYDFWSTKKINSVVLKLTASAFGHDNQAFSNACWLERVTSFKNCPISSPPWNYCNLQPLTTTQNRVNVPSSTTKYENYNIDITQLFLDYLANNSSGSSYPFQIGLKLQDETYGNTSTWPYSRLSFILSGGAIPYLIITFEGGSTSTCQPSATVNPYTKGILGNWRAKKEWLYNTNRVSNDNLNASPINRKTNIRKNGHFETFTKFNYATPTTSANPSWQWRSQSNKFNLKGEEVENVDPLNRYNAAQYGYLQSVPVAVANNARLLEIGYDGFEDYDFNLGKGNAVPTMCGIQDHFSLRTQLAASKVQLDKDLAHSGNNSLKINSGNKATITKAYLDNEPAKIYTTTNNEYQIDAANKGNYLRFGFSPKHSASATDQQKYILSGWIYDGDKTTNTISNHFNLTVNGVAINVNDATKYSKVYMVEGWKRFEIVFTTPVVPATGSPDDFIIEFSATGGNINIDDIRVHPYAAQLKSFAYDANSMRLMAEMDENNFATFYEYDDEGTLIRVKKETEKGISTIKETRSSIRKKP